MVFSDALAVFCQAVQSQGLRVSRSKSFSSLKVVLGSQKIVDIFEIVHAVVMVDIVDVVDIDLVDIVEIIDNIETAEIGNIFVIVDMKEAIWNKARL